MKHKYKPGKCSQCKHEDLFGEIAHMQIVVLYMIKNHCCTSCASQALKQNLAQKHDEEVRKDSTSE